MDNNHVIFANFCWRIVRTTETGGVKLIYDGVPSSGQCNNTGESTTIGNFRFNNDISSPASSGYMYGLAYTYDSKDITALNGSVVFGNDVTYDESTDTYTLIDTYTLTESNNWVNEYSTVANKYHYTCFSSNTSCQKVNYIYVIYSVDKKAYYFELSEGRNHLDILKEMLDNSGNTNDSTAKTAIDTWYKNNMSFYTLKLEDAVFCNDRFYDASISTSGWNKDYSNYDKWLYFNSVKRLEFDNPNLSCSNYNDRYTVNGDTGNGKLTYSIGLMSADEVAFAGGRIWKTNTSYYLYNGTSNWTMSPSYFFSSYILTIRLNYLGHFGNDHVFYQYSIRPSISLKKVLYYLVVMVVRQHLI